MKKSLLTISAIVAAGIAFAATMSDAIHITPLRGALTKVWIEAVESITFSEKTPNGGYNQMNVLSTEGEVTTFDMTRIKSMTYVQSLPESPVTFSVTPHHYCLSFDVKCDDPTVYYRQGAIAVSEIEGKQPWEVQDMIQEREESLLIDLATSAGYDITEVADADIFWNGNQKMDWFPSTTTEEAKLPGSDYIAYVYTAHIGNDGVVFDHNVVTQPVTFKVLEDCGAEFDIHTTCTSRSITAIVDPMDEMNVDYYVGVYYQDDVKEKGLGTLIYSDLANLEQMVYQYGMSWESVLRRGHSEVTKSGYKASDKLCAVVVGVEYGVTITPAFTAYAEIPFPDPTDDCTFDVKVKPIANTISEIDLEITPSSNTTRWMVLMDESSKIDSRRTDALGAEQFIADKIYYYQKTGNFKQSDLKTGAATLNSKSGVRDGVYMEAETEYSFLIFGVDNSGERTTAITRFRYTPEEQTAKNTFTWTWGEQEIGDYFHFYPLTVKCSDPNAKFVFDKNVGNAALYKAQALANPKDFMKSWVNSYGTNLTVYTDEKTLQNAVDEQWNSVRGEWAWSKFIVFFFSYDGAPTSDLYLFEVDSETNEVTQLLPKAE